MQTVGKARAGCRRNVSGIKCKLWGEGSSFAGLDGICQTSEVMPSGGNKEAQVNLLPAALRLDLFFPTTKGAERRFLRLPFAAKHSIAHYLRFAKIEQQQT